MKSTTDLYDLICSLSKSERRYISLSILEKGEKAYLKLFQAMEKQKSFNEKELEILLKKEGISYRLSELKHYLHNYILKKLNNFYYGSSVESTLHQSLLETDILIKKNLYSQAQKKLFRIKKLAEKDEALTLLLQCITREKELFIHTNYKGVSQYDLDQLLKRQMSLTKMIDDENGYRALLDEQNILSRKAGFFRNESQHNKIKRLLRHPLLKNGGSPLSFNSKRYFYAIRAGCYIFFGDYKNALKNIEPILSLLEPRIYAHEHLLRAYVIWLSNKAHSQGMRRDYVNALLTIGKMRNIIKNMKKEGKSNQVMIQYIVNKSYDREIALYMDSGQFAKALDTIPVIEQVIKKYADSMPERFLLVFYYNFSCTQFIFGNYKQALFYLRKILNRKRKDIAMREDIYGYFKILYLLTCYEVQKENLSEYLIKSTYDFIAQDKHLYKTEIIFLSFFRYKLLKNHDPDELTLLLGELKEKMLRNKEKNRQPNTQESFDFISWIESKISGRTFLEVLNEKHDSVLLLKG